MPNPVRGMYFALLKQGKSKEEASAMVRDRFKLFLVPKRKTRATKRRRSGDKIGRLARSKGRHGGKTISSEIAGLHFQGREQYREGGKVPRKYMKQAKKIYGTKLKGWPKKMGGKKRRM